MITQELLCSSFIKVQKGTEKASDTDIRREMESVPPLLVLARELYTFLINHNKSKEYLKFVKILLDALPQYTF